MPIVCCVIGCPNNSKKTRSQLARCYRIPAYSEEIAGKWKDWIANKNGPERKMVKHIAVCENHFRKSCILKNRQLAHNSVPSIGRQNKCASPSPPMPPFLPLNDMSLGDLLGSSECNRSALTVVSCDDNVHCRSTHSAAIFNATEQNGKIACGASEVTIDDASNISTSTPVQSQDSFNKENISLSSLLSSSTPVLKSNAPSRLYAHIKIQNGANHLHALPTATEAGNLSSELNSDKDPLAITDEDRSVLSSPHNSCEQESSVSFQTPNGRKTVNVRKKRKFYLGELSPSDFSTPKRARRNIGLAKDSVSCLKRKLRTERARVRRLRAKVNTLEGLLDHLKGEKGMLDEQAKLQIESAFPGAGGTLFERALNAKRGQFCRELREFALTLHFYSVAGYNYVRQVFMKSLPHEKTLASWYCHVEAEPGFTKTAVEAVKQKVLEMRGQSKQLVLAITADEMHIAKKREKVAGKTYGYPDMGFGNEQPDTGPFATQALVFMAVACNGSWKVPVGYFFIATLNAEQRSVLLKDCISLLLETGAEVASVTFDGNQVNIAAACALGASFNPFGNWRPFFDLEFNGKLVRIEVILDACHMIKLIRNVFGNDEVKLQDKFENSIEWRFLELLQDFQLKEGLSAANKLKQRHTNFFNEKQKVKLAVQLLSRSVADVLYYLEFELNIPEFCGAKATADFIRVMNDCFDVLNSKSQFARGLKGAVTEENISEVRNFSNYASSYIRGLSASVFEGRKQKKWSPFRPVLSTRLKTGFLGLLTGLDAMLSVYDRFVVTKVLSFLGMYKFSQDHVEFFFSAIRARGGWRNNPTARHFVSAYKRLMVHIQISPNSKANCWPIELVSILTVSSRRKRADCAKEGLDEQDEEENDDPDEITLDTVMLSTFVEDVIGYIAGYVSRSVSRTSQCAICCNALFGTRSFSILLTVKNRGGLLFPSIDVVLICKQVEREVRVSMARNELLKVNVQRVILNVKGQMESSLFSCLNEQIYDQNILNNHKDKLINNVIKKYFSIRVNHEAKKMSDVAVGERVRTRNNKLTLFKNQ